MYLDYWQLETKPFEATADRSAFYPCEAHQGALLKLRYGIENHRGALLLAGPSGSGKTMITNMLRQDLPEGFQPFIHLVFPQMSPRDLLAYVATEIGAPQLGTDSPDVVDPQSRDAAPRDSIDQCVRRIQSFLIENTQRNQHAVVAIDEAHLLEDCGSLETLRLLLNFELAGRPGLTLLLIGQPDLLSAVGRLPDFEQRIGVKTLLRALTPDESACYIQHRLQTAGATRDIFTPDAQEAIHYHAHGIPRQIDRLCDLALVVGFADGLPEIAAEQIEAVNHELISVAPE